MQLRVELLLRLSNSISDEPVYVHALTSGHGTACTVKLREHNGKKIKLSFKSTLFVTVPFLH